MGKMCTVDGCAQPVKGHGFCKNHYYRWNKYGDPHGGQASPGEPIRWLFDHVDQEDEGECLKWPFGRDGNGYPGGIIFEGRRDRAHRIMCTLANGSPPDSSMQAAHSCGKGHEACVHPRHLRWATRAENAADKFLHGTSSSIRGEQVHSAALNEDTVRRLRDLRTIGRSYRSLGVEFGVDHKTARSACIGNTWGWVT